MRKPQKKKRKIFLASCIFVLFLSMTLMSCGKDPSYGERDDEATDVEEQDSKAEADILDEEFSELKYIEKLQMIDLNGQKTSYYVYIPVGNEGCESGYVSYYDHGLFFMAFLYTDMETDSSLYAFLEESVRIELDNWNEDKSYGYENIKTSNVYKNGNDRYQIISARTKDYYGTPYEIKKIFYLDVLDEGAGIFWDLEISENEMDSETAAIVEEITECYNIDPDLLHVGGEWAAKDQERIADQQDVYEPEAGDIVLEAVEGYRYMGLATLISYSEDAECPIMLPMGRNTYVSLSSASSYMHGVSVRGNLRLISPKNFEEAIDWNVNMAFEILKENDKNRRVQKGDLITLSEYSKKASYVVFTYEKTSYYSEEYVPMVDVICFIRVNEDYFLEYKITLSEEEYDISTNIVLEELEVAYGIDLSEYYYE